MRNLSIEDSLRSWAKKMVKRYSWLTIRFEYSNDENHYLVSYYFSEKIDIFAKNQLIQKTSI